MPSATEPMRVLLNDGMPQNGLKLFEEAGIATDTENRSPRRLVVQIEQFDALVVRSGTDVTPEVIEAGVKGRLKLVTRAGVGFDNIDLDAASRNGVVVKFAPNGNTNAAAELTVGLMLAASRYIPQAHSSLHEGNWIRKPYEGRELSDSVIALIGCGRIAQRVSQLTLGFGTEAVGYDKYPEYVKATYPHSRIKLMPLEEALRRADYVSIHIDGKDQVIGREELALMKPTACVVNTSRGPTVDEKALYEALASGRLERAALDVYSDEPKKDGASFSNRLISLSNVVTTSHLGASTIEARNSTAEETARVSIGYLKHGDFTGAVNAKETVAAESRPLYTLFVYHSDVPGAFGRIDEVLGNHGINIRDNPSRSLGNGSAIAVYLVHQPVGPEVLADLRKLDVVHYAKL